MEKVNKEVQATIETEPKQEQAKQEGRIKSIDRFRGFCVFAMIIFQFLNHFPSLGFLARLASHDINTGIVILPGMTLADIIAPCFIFAIGLTFVLAFAKYKKLYGRKKAYIRYIARGLSIIGIGGFLWLCNRVVATFSGDTLSVVDITFLVFSAIMLACVVFKLITLLPQLKKIRNISTWALYISMSLLGLLNLVVAGIDSVRLLIDMHAPNLFQYWLVLQNIGMACLVALPLVECKNWVRFLVASIILILYTVLYQIGDNYIIFYSVVHGGFIGGFGWGAMLIFDIFLVELFMKNKKIYITSAALFMAVGLWCVYFLGDISMFSCNPTFIVTSVGLCGLLFYLFYLFDKLPHSSKFDPLVWWGRNPIVMFLVEFFIIGSFETFAPASMLIEAPWWLATIEGVIALVLLTTFCWLLSKMKKSISL